MMTIRTILPTVMPTIRNVFDLLSIFLCDPGLVGWNEKTECANGDLWVEYLRESYNNIMKEN